MGNLSKGCRLSESENDFEGFELICRYPCDSATGKDKIDRGHRPLGRFGMSCWKAPNPRAAGTEISVACLGLGEPSLRRH
ncbi:MAG: hypothetical protein RI963_3757 [Planctomycetota bacterium]|jgi:hypothetical protein